MEHRRGLQQLGILPQDEGDRPRSLGHSERVLPPARQRFGQQRLCEGVRPLRQSRCTHSLGLSFLFGTVSTVRRFPCRVADSSPAASSLSSAFATVGRETPNRVASVEVLGNDSPTAMPSVVITSTSLSARGRRSTLSPSLITRHRPPGTGSATPSRLSTLNARSTTPRETPYRSMSIARVGNSVISGAAAISAFTASAIFTKVPRGLLCCDTPSPSPSAVVVCLQDSHGLHLLGPVAPSHRVRPRNVIGGR